ncbi:MAG TPA: caspase family protein, partial [Blastocatellia bacterium]|nr:caspase family protein [Blastocatellia bacterium]
MTQGRRYAVLIGSSRFDKEPNLRPLKYPENDVNGMHEILRARELGAFDEVAVFNNAESDPVLHKIEEILAAATGDDLFLIYYSGHGQTDLPGRLCLTTSDTEIRILLTTSIPVELLRSLIENSACRKVVLILDCCYSGAAGKSFTKGQVDEKLKDLARGNGIYILTASTASQPALEREGDDYGLLTKHIISGIRDGAADLNNDGVVSLNDLYRYVHQKVRDEGYQEPMYWALNVKGEDLIIARSGRFLIYKEHQQLSDKLIEIRDLLPPQILTRALDAIQNRRSPFYQLIDDLYLDRLRIGEFVEEWYRLDSGVPGPMLPALQPQLDPERPAPIGAVAIEPPPVPALQPISPLSPATLDTINFETVTLDFQGNELSRQILQAQYFVEELDGVSLEMVKIPGGSFTMGSPKDENNRHLNEWPQHQVTVPEFFM